MISTAKVVILTILIGLVVTSEAQNSVNRSNRRHRRIRNLQQLQDHAQHDVLPPLSPLDDVARERNLKAGKGCDKWDKGHKSFLFGGPCDLSYKNVFLDPKGKKGKGGGNYFNQMWPHDKKAKNGLFGYNSQSLYNSGSTIITSTSLQIALSLSTFGGALFYLLI